MLVCSQCSFPRERHTLLCLKCERHCQKDALTEILKKIICKESLDFEALQKELAPRDFPFVLFFALTKGYPLEEQFQQKKHLFWPSLLSEIRFHSKPNSTTCSGFRKLVQQGWYNEIVIPEECCECMNTLLSHQYEKYVNLAIGHLFYSDKDKLKQLFVRHLQTNGGRNSLLNYINFMLWISNSQEYMTPTASRRVIDTLIDAVSIHHAPNKQWILEELILRPENYKFLLATPQVLPGNYTETLFDYFTEFDAWWTFWQRIFTTAKKRVVLRCDVFKDELMATTWSVERVRNWCLDIEESAEVRRYFR